jgi:hypothetical protein
MFVLVMGQTYEACHIDWIGFHGMCLKFQDHFRCPKVVGGGGGHTSRKARTQQAGLISLSFSFSKYRKQARICSIQLQSSPKPILSYPFAEIH